MLTILLSGSKGNVEETAMRIMLSLFLGACLVVATNAVAQNPPAPLLIIEDTPADGLALARVDLTRLLGDKPPPAAPLLRATLLPDQTPASVQFVPDADYVPAHATGMAVIQLPKGGAWKISLSVEPGSTETPKLDDDLVRAKHFALRFAAGKMAGFPSSIEFAQTGKRFENFVWNDRLYDSELGQFWLRYDAEAKPRVVSKGPLCTVVRTAARYCQADGKPSPSPTDAVYDWYVFNEAPLVYVTAVVRQKETFVWNELHFLELNFPDESFRRWAGGDPPKEGAFTASKKGVELGSWGALIDEKNALGMFGGEVRYYDGRGDYGTYLHSTTRYGWNHTESRFSTWLWIGAADAPVIAVREAAHQPERVVQAVLTRPELHDQILALRNSAADLPPAERASALWRAAMAEHQEKEGLLDEAEKVAHGETPANWSLGTAGELSLALHARADGLRVESLFDLRAARELLAATSPPLFSLTLHRPGSKDQRALTADTGWRHVSVEKTGEGFTLTWQEPADEILKGIRATATVQPDGARHAWQWTFRAETQGSDWGAWEVVFPQLAVADLGKGATALVPQGAGQENHEAWNRPFTFHGTYPSGWSSMQFMAVYNHPDDTQPVTGLYFGLHDPFGSTKVIEFEGEPASHSVRLAFEHPAPDMGVPGNGFTLSGEGVWQLFRGDWFDAAMIYKAWAREHAKWWPQLSAEGRKDTPPWMRELCAWAQTGGAPGECVEPVKKLQQFLDVPLGFHWYNWHQIPFDNDYPHYFPPKDGFADGVRDLQAANVFVMPYINGRLWDTRDKGMEDFEFTRVALPAVTKDEAGKPFTEKYGSKEQDGIPVQLGVMCPTTALWQGTVWDIVMRLQQELRVDGVYIDQIAAAAPVLCMDKTHGHPLGGGHWWNEGYWKLLDPIRAAKSPSRMITTECNGEPFVSRMDGYLTWHWQNDGQVPVFPAVYGGAVQMFGRAYGEGPTRDLALRMKAAQQLTFGEQIGWMNPKLILESESGDFFRRAVHLRWRFRRYFYAGEMARPPKLLGDIPKVKADWQWNGEWWVTTDAVLSGAWRLPKENKLVLVFANVSDAPVNTTLKFDGNAYGLAAPTLHTAVIENREGVKETFDLPTTCDRPVTLAPKSIVAWEVTL